jgi:hypothetical protein
MQKTGQSHAPDALHQVPNGYEAPDALHQVPNGYEAPDALHQVPNGYEATWPPPPPPADLHTAVANRRLCPDRPDVAQSLLCTADTALLLLIKTVTYQNYIHEGQIKFQKCLQQFGLRCFIFPSVIKTHTNYNVICYIARV